MDIDFSNSVIMPREDFAELQAAANEPNPLSDKLGSALTTTLIMTGMAGAVTAGTYGWTRAIDWLETRRSQRRKDELAEARDRKAQ